MVHRSAKGRASVSEPPSRPRCRSAAVVQHVQVLEASGLVRSEKIGRVRTCQLEPWFSANARALDRSASYELKRRLDRLGAYLAENPEPEAGSREPRTST